MKRHLVFRVVWRGANLLLAVVVVSSMYAGVREYSVRRYLDGFSDAIVPNSLPEERKLEAILNWMRAEPSRAVSANPDALAKRDPEVTLTYSQLLNVCGTATNAFLNLVRSSDLRARRLLLLTGTNNTKHVVAEVLIGERWIIVDPTYRVILKDAAGRSLTRTDLQNPAVFAQAISAVPNYPTEYTYDHFAHVRLARLPYLGFALRRILGAVVPGWEEAIDWSLLLERQSFFLSGTERCRDAFLFAAARDSCVVCRQPPKNSPFSPARARLARRSGVLLDPGDQTIACAVFAVSPLLRAAKRRSRAHAR